MLVYRRKFLANSLNTIEIQEILELLPHRYPFLLVDRVTDYVLGESVKAYKNITINEPCFMGHFPEQPIFPGVLILEAMAQAAGVLLLRRASSESKVAFFMSADKVKFRKPVVPGDQLIIKAELIKVRGDKLATAAVSCSVADKEVSSANLMFSVVNAEETN